MTGRIAPRRPGTGPAAGGGPSAPTEGAIGAGGVDLGALEALLVRFIPPGSLDQIVFRVDALHALHDGGVPVINPPRALERTVDKHWTSRLLAEAGVPTPRTLAAEGFDEALAAFHDMRDVLVKPLLGSGGRGIVRVTDEDLAYRVFRALEMQRSVFYVQEFVPHGRSDLRFLVVGARVVAAARRTGAGWKTNVAAGAEMRLHRPGPGEEELAVRAARAATEIAASLHCGDIAEVERHAAAGFNRDLFQIGGRADETDPAYDELGTVFLDGFAADVDYLFCLVMAETAEVGAAIHSGPLASGFDRWNFQRAAENSSRANGHGGDLPDFGAGKAAMGI